MCEINNILQKGNIKRHNIENIVKNQQTTPQKLLYYHTNI